MKLRYAILPSALLFASAALYAAAPKPSGPPPSASAPSMPKSPVPPFKQVDTNHDGKISWKEAKAVGVPQKIFKADDFDHNGELNETEWMFVRLDMTKFNAPASATGG